MLTLVDFGQRDERVIGSEFVVTRRFLNEQESKFWASIPQTVKDGKISRHLIGRSMLAVHQTLLFSRYFSELAALDAYWSRLTTELHLATKKARSAADALSACFAMSDMRPCFKVDAAGVGE